MKNSFIFLFFLIIINSSAIAENILIESKNIFLEKKNEITVFEKDVIVKTENGDIIKSDYAKYNKKEGLLILKNNIVAIDKENNIIETQYAEYDEKFKIFRSNGPTKVITSEKYLINGENIFLDNTKKFIKSENNATITDQDKNKVFLNNFEYQTNYNIFKSIGSIRVYDNIGNTYNFSQIYIDTKTKEMLGTDTKAYMNSNDFKINDKNKPRIFANNLKINNKKSFFKKGVFTLCDYRKNDKCPPWQIQASQILHDSKNKTIYYDNAVIKVYNIPIFYFPKLSHPDPTVERRSGFLPPSISDSRNLGSGISVPYFWALNSDKNLTVTNKFYVSENPLFLGEYQQAFKNSSLLTDFGYTEGYKKESTKKVKGNKSHFFSKYTKNFNSFNENDSQLDLSIQNVSNDKYLKLYKVESNLVDFNTNTLENTIDLVHEGEDIFFGFNASAFETLNENYNDKYEYILPEITIDKNILSNNLIGSLDLQSNYKVRRYDTNKLENFLVNSFDWKYKDIYHSSGVKSEILGNFKNVNYETKNIDVYKEDFTSELYGALGYLVKLDLQKNLGKSTHLLTPKILFRYSPGEMRKELNGFRLNPVNAFSIDRLDSINNFETGSTSTIGFDYEINRNKRDFNFSVAQIINERENKKMPSKSSLDEKLSDLTGSVNYKLHNDISLNYNFSLDQNYNDLNYNEVGTSAKINSIKFDFNYLQEKEHIGNQEYFQTKIDYAKSENGLLSLETKRNLVTNSSEFYNLSYEYINDCLRAGLVYRREFYNDSEIEPEDSLMFKITLTPFGDINTPTFNQ